MMSEKDIKMLMRDREDLIAALRKSIDKLEKATSRKLIIQAMQGVVFHGESTPRILQEIGQ